VIGPEAPVEQASAWLDYPPKVGSLLVVDDEHRLIGIVCRRDLLFLSSRDRDPAHGKNVRDVMSGAAGLITAPEGTSRENVVSILHNHRIEQTIVIDVTGRPLDVVSVKDLALINKMCFVMLPFTEPYLTIFSDHVRLILEREMQLQILKADDIFRPEAIIQSVHDLIRKADVLVAEISERNPNVYYEIGFAHGIGKRVIFLTRSMENVPFDLRHLRCVVYEYTPRGSRKLKKDLLASVQAVLDEHIEPTSH
jgi:hypothetical protein